MNALDIDDLLFILTALRNQKRLDERADFAERVRRNADLQNRIANEISQRSQGL